MAADGRANARAVDLKLVLGRLEHAGKRVAVGHAVRVANCHHVALVGRVVEVLVELGHLAHGLPAAARHAHDCQRTIEVEGEERLHVEKAADHGDGLGDAASTVERIEVVHHEDGVSVEARVLCPGNQLLGRQTLVALLDEVLRGGSYEAVDYVDGRGERAAVLLAHAVKRRHGTVVRAGDAAREGKVNRGDAGGNGLLERLLVDHLGGLRGHGAGAVLDGGVEVVGRA